MRVEVRFHGEQLGLEIPDERLIGHWAGPPGLDPADVQGLVAASLENPRGYPPLRQSVVPDDRVVVALDGDLPESAALLRALCATLEQAGVAPDSILILLAGLPDRHSPPAVPEGTRLVIHDPADTSQLAYLASTSQGRRIYLNRHLTDADSVVAVGRLGYDPVLGYRGPWGVLFPGLSNEETASSFRALASDEAPAPDRPRAALSESAEVSWLLGSQFQVGVVPGTSGLVDVIAGLDSEVRRDGTERLDRAWSFRAESRADLVVVGIGGDGPAGTVDDLAAGLHTASRLVRHGGKIVALSKVEGPIGPSLRRLIGAGDPRAGTAALHGMEAEPDYPAALRLAHALGWADVYLHSRLDPDLIDELSMIALDRPEEARRLAATSPSCIVLSRAELTRASTADEEE